MQVTLKTTLKRSRHKQFFWHKIDSTYDIIIMDHGETCTYVYLSSLNICHMSYIQYSGLTYKVRLYCHIRWIRLYVCQ